MALVITIRNVERPPCPEGVIEGETFEVEVDGQYRGIVHRNIRYMGERPTWTTCCPCTDWIHCPHPSPSTHYRSQRAAVKAH